METEFARTFLTVIAAGNFVNAAARLHVTQSTVSARIRALEEYLGCRLFVRNKAGTSLTPAGREFQRHAALLVQTLERARQEVGVPQGFRGMLTVGGRFGLWDDLLQRWLAWMQGHAPDIAVRAEIGFEADLMQRLVEGTMDVGVMYTPQSRPALVVEPLLDEELVLVERPEQRRRKGDTNAERYVHVDWGPEFYTKHQTHFPELHPPALVVAIGWLGLEHILNAGGSGYFPERLVREPLAADLLVRVPDAPLFTLPAYLVYSEERDTEIVDPALQGMRDVAASVRSG